MQGYRNLSSYDEGGVNPTTHHLIGQWLTKSGLVMDRVIEVVPERAAEYARLQRAAAQYLASELIVVGRKAEKVHQSAENQNSEIRR